MYKSGEMTPNEQRLMFVAGFGDFHVYGLHTAGIISGSEATNGGVYRCVQGLVEAGYLQYTGVNADRPGPPSRNIGLSDTGEEWLDARLHISPRKLKPQKLGCVACLGIQGFPTAEAQQIIANCPGRTGDECEVVVRIRDYEF